MAKRTGDLLQGTLDMMILRIVSLTPNHGYGIARRIQQMSEDVLRVEEGSLYPALHRLEKRGMLTSDWKQSESNRRAKYYRLTPRGTSQLGDQSRQWAEMSRAVSQVMNGNGPTARDHDELHVSPSGIFKTDPITAVKRLRLWGSYFLLRSIEPSTTATLGNTSGGGGGGLV